MTGALQRVLELREVEGERGKRDKLLYSLTRSTKKDLLVEAPALKKRKVSTALRYML